MSVNKSTSIIRGAEGRALVRLDVADDHDIAMVTLEVASPLANVDTDRCETPMADEMRTVWLGADGARRLARVLNALAAIVEANEANR